MNVSSFAFKASGLSKNGLENTNPLWKFVLDLTMKQEVHIQKKTANI